MEPEELPVVLYDFLYRDSGRIASYYAQFFREGHLTSIEQTDQTHSGSDVSGEVNVAVIKGGTKANKGQTETLKRVSAPHDLITTDILSGLIEGGRISEDIESALHGALVIAKGTLVFADRYMLETSILAFETTVQPNQRPKTPEEREEVRHQKNGLKILKGMLEKLTFPSAFLLSRDNGTLLAGTIKDEGMEEPISTYYFKHGAAGLPNVHMIGIKEVGSLSFQLPSENLLGAAQEAAQVLRTLVFPPDATIVTPIALFRKI